MLVAFSKAIGKPCRQRRLIHCSSLLYNSSHRFNPKEVEREADDVDVCIVGAGPAGLSAAIRLKQLEKETGKEIRVVVLEKGGEVGSHTLSGAVIEPRALNELLPDWSNLPGHPLTRPATNSSMRFLTPKYSIPMPHPPQMSNKGNYIVSLSQFTSWLGTIAEEHGVEIYPGFAGSSLIYSEDGKSVRGVVTNDVGIDKQYQMKDSFEPGMMFRAKVTLLAEGAHGSLTKEAVKKFNLREGKDPQTYGIGVKEVWRVDEKQYRPGEVIHTMGYPLDYRTYGGGWVYHMDDGLVSLGIVIGLDYANPYLSPYCELQKMKHHPYFRQLLAGGERIAYGGRTINEGGLQSLPKLHFPGGALIGCSAGFVNVPKIKGTHNAMKSGMLAAENAFKAIESLPETESSEEETEYTGPPVDMSPYESAVKDSWVWKELNEIRNVRPSFNTSLGIWGGMAWSGLDTLILRGKVPWTFHNRISDAAHTKKASECKPPQYPPFEPPLSTDLLTALALTSTNHAENQFVHLRLPHSTLDNVEEARKARKEHVKTNVQEYAGLLGRACPAGVYEYVDQAEANPERVEDEGWDGKKLVINSQNCIHCKLCDIKVPTQDITWTVPEGGGGPKYSIT
ncbi:hypothetical protein FRC03_002080 [Tulasnella sp. 419]|nr:hypothetical protein FRC03_002080 [Tulasnella sp. 419]